MRFVAVLVGLVALLLCAASGRAAAPDCLSAPSTPYCQAQIDELRAQKALADAQRDELVSPFHWWATNIGAFSGAAAGLGALFGVIYGLLQYQQTLKAQQETLQTQKETASIQLNQVLDGQFLEASKRLSDANPATRIGAVSLLMDLSEKDNRETSVPGRYVAKQLAAVFAVEENHSVILAIQDAFTDLRRSEEEGLDAVLAALNSPYVRIRYDDLDRALAEYDAFGQKVEHSAAIASGLTGEDLARRRSSPVYVQTNALAKQPDYFGPGVSLAQVREKLAVAGLRTTSLSRILGRQRLKELIDAGEANVRGADAALPAAEQDGGAQSTTREGSTTS